MHHQLHLSHLQRQIHLGRRPVRQIRPVLEVVRLALRSVLLDRNLVVEVRLVRTHLDQVRGTWNILKKFKT